MSDTVSIEAFRRAVHALPSDEPRDDPAVWYRTQEPDYIRLKHEPRGRPRVERQDRRG